MNCIKKILLGAAVVCTAAIITCSAYAAESVYSSELPIWDGTVATSYAGGTGTESDPYLISNGAQLAYLMQEINATTKESQQTTAGEYYKLTNDIVLNDVSDIADWDAAANAPENVWTPGGAVENYMIKGFAGTLDGNNYDIIGLYVNSTDPYNGLFGYVYNGQINNLGIRYSYINGGANTAAVAGYIRAAAEGDDSTAGVTVSGCTVSDTTIKGKSSVGSVGGYVEAFNNTVVIEKCELKDSTVAGNNYVGGIGGHTVAFYRSNEEDGSTVDYTQTLDKYAVSYKNCVNTGTISGRIGVGGIMGSSKDFVSPNSADGKIYLLIENCVNNGNISASGDHKGSIAGTVGPADREDKNVVTDIKNCYGNDAYGLYGYSASTTNADTSKVYTSAQMGNTSNFGALDLDKVWDIVTNGKAPSLRVYGDALGDGELTAADIIAYIEALAGNEVDGLELANIDFNGDGELDMEELNTFMDYLKNKGAAGKN